MLLQHNTMDAVSVVLERESIQEFSEDANGGWHTEGSLLLLPGWNE